MSRLGGGGGGGKEGGVFLGFPCDPSGKGSRKTSVTSPHCPFKAPPKGCSTLVEWASGTAGRPVNHMSTAVQIHGFILQFLLPPCGGKTGAQMTQLFFVGIFKGDGFQHSHIQKSPDFHIRCQLINICQFFTAQLLFVTIKAARTIQLLLIEIYSLLKATFPFQCFIQYLDAS